MSKKLRNTMNTAVTATITEYAYIVPTCNGFKTVFLSAVNSLSPNLGPIYCNECLSYITLYTNLRYYARPDWSIWSKTYVLLCR